MRVLLMHTLDSYEQYAGVEEVIMTLANEFDKLDGVDVAVALNKGRLYDELSAKGIKLYPMPAKGFIKLPGYLLSLSRTITDFSADIVHSHHRFTTLAAQLLPFRRYKVIHTLHVEQFTRRWNKFFGDITTAVSQGTKDHFVTHFGVDPERIHVIHNGIDPLPSDIKARMIDRSAGDTLAIVVGRLTEQKGHSVLLQAMALLPEEYRSRFRVIFLGSGELRDEIEDTIAELGLAENVTLAGFVEDVYPYILASDFMVLPSRWEGFGLVIVESFLCGKAVIGTNVGGIPEVIEDGVSGFVVPPEDPESLKRQIIDFMDSPKKVEAMGRAGRERVQEYFTIKRMISSYIRLYKDLLGVAGK